MRSALAHPAVRLVLVVSILAVLVLAVGPGVLAAGTSGASLDSASGTAADPCTSVNAEPAVVVTPPIDEPTGPGGTAGVYNGSELVVHLCQPDNGTRSLDADGLEWATVLDDEQERLRIRVRGPTNDSLGVLASPEPVPGPSLAIVDHAVETELAAGPIPVGGTDRASDLRGALEDYRTAESTITTRLATLRNATESVENGSIPTGSPIEATIAARADYRAASAQLRTELYEIADSPFGGPRTAAAIRELTERSATMENRTEARLESHDAALRDRQESLTWSLRLRIVGLGLLGLVLGATVGAILPIRRGRAARRRLAQGAWTTYSRRAVLVPVVIGVVLCCLAVGWLALTAPDAIVEVMTP